MGITREEIDKEGWLGGQRQRVLELLARAESAEKRVIALSGGIARLRDRAVQIIERAKFHDDGMTDSSISADLQREVFVFSKVEDLKSELLPAIERCLSMIEVLSDNRLHLVGVPIFAELWEKLESRAQAVREAMP